MFSNLSKSESLNLKFKDFKDADGINDFVKEYNKSDSSDFTVQILGVIPSSTGLTVAYLKHTRSNDDDTNGKLTY